MKIIAVSAALKFLVVVIMQEMPRHFQTMRSIVAIAVVKKENASTKRIALMKKLLLLTPASFLLTGCAYNISEIN